ncbi:UBX domain-containing protein 10 [Elasticomyces elasticus]|nr:UBX domain-containing protein 10 [Elasticomyces elasticus]KAK4985634.1 UBX domain-containing protein 10 [Elasticomyces elasticus]
MSTPAVDLAALSETQQLALQQYTSVTDQELDAALPLLQKCQWNAQIAITRFFDGDADTIDPAAEAARSLPPPTSRRQETLLDSFPLHGTRSNRFGLEEAPRITTPPESQLTRPAPLFLSILFLPFNLVSAVFSRLFSTVGWAFPFLPRLLDRIYPSQPARRRDTSGRQLLGPQETAARFVREFEEEYGVTHPPFFEGGYAQAFDLAKRDLKYLLIVLLSPEHDDTAPFVHSTLLSPDVISFVSDPQNNIICWAGSVQDAEAYSVSNALNVTKYPFAALICHTPSVSSTSMSIVARLAGPTPADALIQKLQQSMGRHSAELSRVRAQRAEQQASRSLREEQNSAYERSLAQDRERANKRRKEEAAREKAEREGREKEEAKARAARNLAQWKRWRIQSLPAEPGPDTKDAVRISVRLPDGERIIRRFGSDADIEQLYAFVECHDILQAESESEISEKEARPPEKYEHVYAFQLVSPMPREVYEVAKGGTIRERVGRSGNLIVERLVDEDEVEVEDGNE